ncbi:uncharacterized protein [Triticum aestivum]|uniref:uncharacterized protein isoform X1 n=1 Tax=Triticum aestivum TaxID=4565 RepID=UPI001D002106|nr:uncharacterized protein LOC123070149 isoform X1 [Triticum aestivum]
MLAAATAGRRAIAPHQEKRRRSRRPPPCQGVAERTALRMHVGRLCCRAAWRAVVLLRREERCCRDVVVAAVDGRADGGRGVASTIRIQGEKGGGEWTGGRRLDLPPSGIESADPRPISFKRVCSRLPIVESMEAGAAFFHQFFFLCSSRLINSS